MNKAKLVKIVSFLPEKVIENEQFLKQILAENPELIKNDVLLDSPFFKGVKSRHFASPEYSSSDLGVAVAKKLLKQCNKKAEEIDLILCSCIFSDSYWPGIATDIQNKIGACNASIIQIDTSCCSFLTGLNIAQAYIKSNLAQSVMILTVTNFISRLTEFQKSPRSFVLGDGATATLVVSGDEDTIIASHEQSFGENYGLMRFEPEEVAEGFINYWQKGCGPITVNFDQYSIDRIRENALKIVPQMVRICLNKASMKIEDTSWVLTHQPNRFFIDQWRSALHVKRSQCYDTLKKYGNLFQGSIPVTLADGIEKNLFKSGDTICMGTFSNGGDYGAAMLIRLP